MKICLICPRAYQLFDPEVKSSFGGVEVQLSLIAKRFAKKRHVDTHFMVADFGQDDCQEYENVKVWKSLSFDEPLIKQILNFFSVFRKIDAEVYIQSALTPFSWLMALYCKLTGKKFVYMVAHDNEVVDRYPIYMNRVSKRVANLVFKYASLILHQNKYQEAMLRRKNIPSKLFSCVYEIPDFDEPPQKDYILWVARSEAWKRPELFIELAKSFPEEKFCMVCSPATYNLPLYEHIKSQAQKVYNLKFVEFVPFNEIDDYFQGAKIFVNTSTQEGFPNTFIHATKNKAVILSLNVNPDNFLEEYNCGFYCYDDVAMMHRKLSKLLEDIDLYHAMADNAFRYAKENHDIEIYSDKLLALIQETRED